MDKKSVKVDRHNDDSTMIQEEMTIPKSKVGLIIGKGGDRIKNLERNSGAKIFLIQDREWRDEWSKRREDGKFR